MCDLYNKINLNYQVEMNWYMQEAISINFWCHEQFGTPGDRWRINVTNNSNVFLVCFQNLEDYVWFKLKW